MESSVTQFSLSAYTQASAQIPVDQNLVVSPSNLASAVTALGQGATDEAQAEMKAVLGLNDLAAMNNALNRLAQSSGGALKAAGGIWIDDRLTGGRLNTQLLKEISDKNKLEIKPKSTLVGAEDEINRYISERTGGMIQDLLPSESIQDLTSLVLATCLYLNDKWAVPFNPENNQDRNFNGAAGMIKGVTYMVGYQHPLKTNLDPNDDNCSKTKPTVVVLPYSDDSGLEFVAIMPPKEVSLAEFEKNVLSDANEWKRLLGSVGKTTTEDFDLFFPKFSIASDLQDPIALLKKLGINKIFGEDALSPMGLEGDVVSDILHRAKIELDEKGTKAAAASAVMILSFGQSAPSIWFDRPFFFAVVNTANDPQSGKTRGQVPLFLGRVANPKQTS